MKQAYEMVNVPPDWYVKITKFSIHVKLQVPYKRAEILQLLPWSRISPTHIAQKGIPAIPHRIFMDAAKDHIALLGTAEVFANNCILILEPTDYQLEGYAVPSWGEFRQFAYQMVGACAALIGGSLLMLNSQLMERKDIWSLAPFALLGWGVVIICGNLLIFAVDVFHIRRKVLNRLLGDLAKTFE